MVPGARAERGPVGGHPQRADAVFMSEQDGDTGPFQHVPDIYGVIVIACEQQATFKENDVLPSELFSRQPALRPASVLPSDTPAPPLSRPHRTLWHLLLKSIVKIELNYIESVRSLEMWDDSKSGQTEQLMQGHNILFSL